MGNNKTLLLVPSRDLYYFDNVDSISCAVAPVFQKNNGWLDIFRKIVRKLNSPLTALFYGNWYKEISGFKKIIVFDTSYAMDINLLHNISRVAPHAERYVYSWNIVQNEHKFIKSLKNARSNGFIYYSYDCNDCKKYGLEFNTIMYDPDLGLDATTEQAQYDVLFLGFLKDRKDKILSLYQILLQSELRAHFVIVDKTKQCNSLPFDIRDCYVSYVDYLNMLKKSRAILDITQKGQNGFSMRVMESIYLGKKLISTNTALLNADFYNPNNILVVDVENVDTHAIQEFMNIDFQPYPDKIKSYYSIDSWINRFVPASNK